MASSLQTANARILEVPVTIQGARTVEGENRRELFTESTKTTLVFEKGAVVGLKVRVSAGQNLFVRNDQTGREIMCRVLESRQTGDLSYVDLEFTSYGPDFWDAPQEKSQPVAPSPDSKQSSEEPLQSAPAPPQSAQLDASPQSNPLDTKLDARQKIELAVQQLAASQTKPETATNFSAEKEELLSATEPAPAPASPAPELEAMFASNVDTLAPQLARPTSDEEADSPEPAAASPLPPNLATAAASETSPEHSEGEPDIEKDSAQLAALIAIDDRKRAKREATAKAKAEAGEASDSVAQGPSDASSEAAATAVSSDTTSRPASAAPPLAALSIWFKTFGMQKMRAGIGIAAAILLAATIGVVWHARRAAAARASVARGSNLPASAWNGASQPAPVPSARSQAPASPAASAAGSTGVSVSVSQRPIARAKAPSNSPARLADVKDSGAESPTRSDETPARAESSERRGPSERAALDRRKRATMDAPPSAGFVPPKIVSEPQPGFPTWANGIDLDPVVRLDALIDEKGNVTETKVLSGPRILQREAEKAVALWIFEPATSDGKPVPTHLVLTVEFQR
jgi:TonB family protein